MKKISESISFYNKVIDKSQLKYLIVWAFRTYGIARAANMADKLKDLGFHYATKAGISLSLEDLRIPPAKQKILDQTIKSIEETDNLYKRGQITVVERFQRTIDTWNNASENLKQEVIKYFKNTDPLNSIYMMAFSGARANISQVRQLVGMRGLMADPQGQIIDLPISTNFREGLTITDYFISSYGARKGLVDTALRTADSGYLTRRLVDVAQDVIIRDVDCKTHCGILIEDMLDNNNVCVPLKQALLGRVLAENLYSTTSNNLIASYGQSLNPDVIDCIINSGIKKVLIRSPLTCKSQRSVCQYCYGWNLAHGKNVDIGEAVGIIAAQSIGEPGTQLTMRTFHTGGVFTGQLAETIISDVNGFIEYSNNYQLYPARTRHGNHAMRIDSDGYLKLISYDNKVSLITLIKGTLILVGHKSSVKTGDIIAQYPLSSRMITERAQKAIFTDFSGIVHLMDLELQKIKDKENYLKRAQNSGIIWILSGKVYDIPQNAQLMVSSGQVVRENDLIVRTRIVSKYDGQIRFKSDSKNKTRQKMSVITSSNTLINARVRLDKTNQNRYILQTDKNEQFILKIKSNDKIVNNQIIADLSSDLYRTKTGGIIKYLDLSLLQSSDKSNQDYYSIRGSGYILWISEETHEVNKDISLLLVKHGEFVEVGTEIMKNVFASNSGVLEIRHKDGIVREIIIKPGEMYSIPLDKIEIFSKKNRGFLRPGEVLVNTIKSDKLVYWESIKYDENLFILIRPVSVYSMPDKKIHFQASDDSFTTDVCNLKLVRKTSFKDGERIKSVVGVNLISTHLIACIKDDDSMLDCFVEFKRENPFKDIFLLNFSTIDFLNFKDISSLDYQDLKVNTRLLVEDNQHIVSGSVIAQTEAFCSIESTIVAIQNNTIGDNRVLMMSQLDTRVFFIDNNQSIKVRINDWVYSGDEIATNVITSDSGKIIAIRDNQITMQIGRPYLISDGSLVHVGHNSLVKKGENIATLIFERAKTGDIVQGLPRIEEILEARKKSDNALNPHIILETQFRTFLNKGLNLYDATRLSLLEVQLALVKEVQLVYQSQGVDIADKHIEIIVKQMTSKVKIENGGATEYLPGEMVELQQIESTNRSLFMLNKEQALYHPILLGITKASLNTESFISAASFQETTKVLTEAAISGKLDWLRGLKENVIIGRLIPAGTGFNVYNNPMVKNSNNLLNLELTSQKNTCISKNSESGFEDIILDDRDRYNSSVN
uniref:DNA-directed RNA polymerase n=1 Tax=Gelidium elegans TaxID=37200 RepID=A0A141SDD4_GELEL|nr:RNA polymerase beta'' subunit [Gelidium elegans]AMK96302.1 RNA polymerase beta'' subunit [Gelidium elegans]